MNQNELCKCEHTKEEHNFTIANMCNILECKCTHFKKKKSHSPITRARASEEYTRKTLSVDNGKDNVLNSYSSVPHTPLTNDDIYDFDGDYSTLKKVDLKDVVSALNGLRNEIKQEKKDSIRIDKLLFLLEKWFPIEVKEE